MSTAVPHLPSVRSFSVSGSWRLVSSISDSWLAVSSMGAAAAKPAKTAVETTENFMVESGRPVSTEEVR